jgi:dihydrofolate synthase/folylpolyglutamate synthase
MGRVLDYNDDVGATLFEVNTAVAFLAFGEVAADVCIVEVGLGGRLDATNVIDRPLVTAIAGLGLDHQQFLGKRLIDIAGEKAGIAKRAVPLVTQAYPPVAAGRIRDIAERTGARWLPRGSAWDANVRQGKLRYSDAQGELDLPLPRLPGRHQAMNAGLAVAMLRHQSALPVAPASLAAALQTATWPARLQRLAPGPVAGTHEVWLDGGHNPAAARQVAAWAGQQFSDGKALHLIFASLASKDPRGMLEPFRGIAGQVHSVPIADHACVAPAELASLAAELGFEATARQSVAAAIAELPSAQQVLIFGSLYLAGEVLSANNQAPD